MEGKLAFRPLAGPSPQRNGEDQDLVASLIEAAKRMQLRRMKTILKDMERRKRELSQQAQTAQGQHFGSEMKSKSRPKLGPVLGLGSGSAIELRPSEASAQTSPQSDSDRGVNGRDEKGRTALHFASGMASTDCALVLLDSGADISVRDNEGFTPLHMAAGYGRSEVADLLLKRGASPLAKDRLGRTPRELAVEIKDSAMRHDGSGVPRGDVEATIALLGNAEWQGHKQRQQLQQQQHQQQQQQQQQQQHQQQQELPAQKQQKQQQRRQEPEQQQEHQTQEMKEEEKKQRKAKVAGAGSKDIPAASGAVSAGEASAKADLSALERMVTAASSGDVAAVMSVLQSQQVSQDSDVSYVANRVAALANSLSVACRHGHPEVATALLRAGAAVDAVDAEGATPLLAAADSGATECVVLLLKAGAQVDARDKVGVSALIASAYNGHSECVKRLIEHKALVNARSHGGVTPLIAAGEGRHADCIKLLLEAGADVDAKTSEGKTALMHAVSRNAEDAVVALVEGGADLNAADGEGLTALHHGARAGSAEAIRVMIERGADITRRCKKGRTALKEAATDNEVFTILAKAWHALEEAAAKQQQELLDMFDAQDSKASDAAAAVAGGPGSAVKAQDQQKKKKRSKGGKAVEKQKKRPEADEAKIEATEKAASAAAAAAEQAVGSRASGSNSSASMSRSSSTTDIVLHSSTDGMSSGGDEDGTSGASVGEREEDVTIDTPATAQAPAGAAANAAISPYDSEDIFEIMAAAAAAASAAAAAASTQAHAAAEAAAAGYALVVSRGARQRQAAKSAAAAAAAAAAASPPADGIVGTAKASTGSRGARAAAANKKAKKNVDPKLTTRTASGHSEPTAISVSASAPAAASGPAAAAEMPAELRNSPWRQAVLKGAVGAASPAPEPAPAAAASAAAVATAAAEVGATKELTSTVPVQQHAGKSAREKSAVAVASSGGSSSNSSGGDCSCGHAEELKRAMAKIKEMEEALQEVQRQALREKERVAELERALRREQQGKGAVSSKELLETLGRLQAEISRLKGLNMPPPNLSRAPNSFDSRPWARSASTTTVSTVKHPRRLEWRLPREQPPWARNEHLQQQQKRQWQHHQRQQQQEDRKAHIVQRAHQKDAAPADEGRWGRVHSRSADDARAGELTGMQNTLCGKSVDNPMYIPTEQPSSAFGVVGEVEVEDSTVAEVIEEERELLQDDQTGAGGWNGGLGRGSEWTALHDLDLADLPGWKSFKPSSSAMGPLGRGMKRNVSVPDLHAMESHGGASHNKASLPSIACATRLFPDFPPPKPPAHHHHLQQHQHHEEEEEEEEKQQQRQLPQQEHVHCQEDASAGVPQKQGGDGRADFPALQQQQPSLFFSLESTLCNDDEQSDVNDQDTTASLPMSTTPSTPTTTIATRTASATSPAAAALPTAAAAAAAATSPAAATSASPLCSERRVIRPPLARSNATGGSFWGCSGQCMLRSASATNLRMLRGQSGSSPDLKGLDECSAYTAAVVLAAKEGGGQTWEVTEAAGKPSGQGWFSLVPSPGFQSVDWLQ